MAKPKTLETTPASFPPDSPATADPMAETDVVSDAGDSTEAPAIGPDGKSIVKTVTETATTNVAYGKTLPAPLTYSWTRRVFASWQQVLEHGAGFSEKELLAVRVAKDNANARSAAYQAALDDAGIVKPTAENDEQVALRDAYKTIIVQVDKTTGQKYTHEAARKRASDFLGFTWAD